MDPGTHRASVSLLITLVIVLLLLQPLSSWSIVSFRGASAAPGSATFETEGTQLATSAVNITRISLGQGTAPLGTLAYDPTNNDLYVADEGSGAVFVISGATNSVSASVDLGQNATDPYGVAFDASNDEIYVSNPGSGTVSVISGRSNTVVTTIDLGSKARGELPLGEIESYPAGIAVDSSNDNVFVSNPASGTLSVISGSSNLVKATVALGNVTGIAYDPANGDVYATDPNNGTVVVISASTYSILGKITVGYNPWSVAYDASDDDIYVVPLVFAWGVAQVISGATNELLTTVACLGSVDNVAVDATSGEVFVTSGASIPGAGEVFAMFGAPVVAGVWYEEESNAYASPGFYSIAVDSANGDAYVVSSYRGHNFVSVIGPAPRSQEESTSSANSASSERSILTIVFELSTSPTLLAVLVVCGVGFVLILIAAVAERTRRGRLGIGKSE